MKKYLFAVLFVVTSITTGQAQRMLPKQKGLEISTGTLSYDSPGRNYYLNIGLTVNDRNGNYKLWALEYTHQYSKYKGLRIPQETYSMEGGYSFYLLGDIPRNISLNTAITGLIGYETINRGTDILYDGAKILNEENFIYGAGGKLSIEAYLSNHLVLLLQAKAKLFWGTSLEQLRPSAGVGLRYNF
ncbi:Conjugative transposon protein TraO [Mariniflexile rhizosphaerae]|uniref:conjugal transfer protein TraO n=1 Tax=unclassified Mariniflexile TaxID=2643887 RepID=UPI000E3350AF|nr:conjugal transfer protein TraO [Mariniflexile sp. TRM1-10]AXP79751.1 Conjugative transposon protein TraO [Mariniflexile sp. TRM1-10]